MSIRDEVLSVAESLFGGVWILRAWTMWWNQLDNNIILVKLLLPGRREEVWGRGLAGGRASRRLSPRPPPDGTRDSQIRVFPRARALRWLFNQQTNTTALQRQLEVTLIPQLPCQTWPRKPPRYLAPRVLHPPGQTGLWVPLLSVWRYFTVLKSNASC